MKFQLGMLDPLGLPLVTQVVAGNSADDPLYAPALRQVQASIGAGGKTYVGDVKMAARATRTQLVASDDCYLCPLSEKQLSREQRIAIYTNLILEYPTMAIGGLFKSNLTARCDS